MKKQILLCIFFCTPLLQADAAKAMPSVAAAFGGLSEDEITQQVKLGQQFLEDLEKFGSPEEKAQFEQLLIETLNSMSEEDFNDLTKIATMVEPNLDIPATQQPEPTTPSPTVEQPVQK